MLQCHTRDQIKAKCQLIADIQKSTYASSKTLSLLNLRVWKIYCHSCVRFFFVVVNSCQADGRLKVLSLLVVAGGQMKSTKWLKPDEPLLILILQWKVPLRVMAVTQRQFEWSSLWWSFTFSTIIPQRLLYKDSKKAPGWTFNLQKTRLWLPLAYTSSFLLVTQWCWPVLSDARVRYALLSISHAPSSAKSMGTTIPSGTHAAWFSSWYTSHLNLF